MRDVRAVVYGVGAMGSILTRLLLDKGVKIVGAVGRQRKSPRRRGEGARVGERGTTDYRSNQIVAGTVSSDSSGIFSAKARTGIDREFPTRHSPFGLATIFPPIGGIKPPPIWRGLIAWWGNFPRLRPPWT